MASSNPPPYKVKAAYEYSSSHEDDLSFSQGQIITVTEEEGSEWLVGEYTDESGVRRSGLFPFNFVERYEPAPPPRPVRSKNSRPTEPDGEQQSLRTSAEPTILDEHSIASPAPADLEVQQRQVEPPSQPSRTDKVTATAESITREPPPIAAKSSSFRDRIAAFNKSAAPPIAPFKPTTLGASSFIKKPFVAPPPSRNAYVPPPPRETPTQVYYRREEDPEIAERQAQDLENAERAGLVPTNDHGEEADQDVKPVSLKERIALLQKQQREQAARRGEASSKERPRQPNKTRAESREAGDGERSSMDAGLRRSLDVESQRSFQQAPPPPPPRIPVALSDASDQDDDDEEAASHDHSLENLPRMDEASLRRRTSVRDEQRMSQSSSAQFGHNEMAMARSADVQHESVEEDNEDEDLDEEAQHQIALRQRMAKLSGGMGMPGMFAPAGALTMLGMAAPAQRGGATGKKFRKASQSSTSALEAAAPSSHPSQNQAQPLAAIESIASDSSHNAANDGGQADIAINSPSTGSDSNDDLPETLNSRMSDMSPVSTKVASSAPPVPRRQEPIQNLGTAHTIDDPAYGVQSRDNTDEQTLGLDQNTPTINESGYEDDDDADVASNMRHEDALRIGSRATSADNGNLFVGTQTAASSSLTPEIPAAVLPFRAVPPPPPTTVPKHSTSFESGTLTVDESNGEAPDAAENEYDPYRYGPRLVSPVRSDAGSPSMISPPMPTSVAPPPLPKTVAPSPVSVSAVPPPVPIGAPPAPSPSTNEEQSHRGLEASTAQEESAEIDEFPPQTSSNPKDANKRSSRAEFFVSRSTRSSVDVDRTPLQRRSTDQHRLSISNEYIASDVAIAETSLWWTKPHGLPPSLQDRNDLYHEMEETIVPKRGGKSLIHRDIYILFRDYSQSVLSVRFDAKNPTDANFEQRHEPPPVPMRQDQLEHVYNQYGVKLADAASKMQNNIVSDGSPQALIVELTKNIKDVLPPVGSRAFGALIYTNLANATVQQFDEIRPGDIVSFRNAKFSGKHGGVMHQKYQMEAGKPDHAAVILEWDGTKKKIRAVEQGRESKKCKAESFRLGDLKSGEVRVWRVMNRAWVGWESGSD